MKYSYDALSTLRKHTRLSIIKKLRVLDEFALAEKCQAIYNKVENCYISVDYTNAEQLEYTYRMKAWYDKIAEIYIKYGNGKDFYEFSDNLLKQAIESDKIKKKSLV